MSAYSNPETTYSATARPPLSRSRHASKSSRVTPANRRQHSKPDVNKVELRKEDGKCRHRVLGFLPTAFVLLITLGSAFLILFWLISRQYEPMQGGRGLVAALRNGSFVVQEGSAPSSDHELKGNLRALTFSALWLSSSGASDLSAAMHSPSPLQYGLLIRLLGSSSIMSIYETGKYIQAKKRARLPRLFMEAFSLAITIWVMSHAVGIADFYLHATTHAILVDIPAFDAAPGSYPYSVAFNRTPCGNASYTYAPWEDSCVSYYTGRYTYEAYGLAFATITNQTRSKFQVKTLADASDAAIIVPTNAVDLSSIMYTAQTIGARAQCRSLNSDCRDVFQLNCTKAGFPSLPFYKEELTGMMPTDGFVSDGTPVSLILGYIDGQLVNATMGHTKNPVKLGVQLQRNLYANQASANQASVPVEPKAGSADSALDYVYLASKPAIVTLLAACSVEFSNLTIQYSPSSRSWTIVHEEPSSDNFASILWTPTVSQMGTDQLANEIMPFAEGNHVINVTAALNQGLARMMLGLAVGPMYLAEASNVRLVVPTLLGQYPVGAIMALVILLLLYAVLTLFIFASSWLTMDETIVVSGDQNGAPKEQSVLNLTQRWLVNPLPLVAAAFPGNDDKDVQRTVAGSAVEMVYDENGSDIREEYANKSRAVEYVGPCSLWKCNKLVQETVNIQN